MISKKYDQIYVIIQIEIFIQNKRGRNSLWIRTESNETGC